MCVVCVCGVMLSRVYVCCCVCMYVCVSVFVQSYLSLVLSDGFVVCVSGYFVTIFGFQTNWLVCEKENNTYAKKNVCVVYEI